MSEIERGVGDLEKMFYRVGGRDGCVGVFFCAGTVAQWRMNDVEKGGADIRRQMSEKIVVTYGAPTVMSVGAPLL